MKNTITTLKLTLMTAALALSAQSTLLAQQPQPSSAAPAAPAQQRGGAARNRVNPRTVTQLNMVADTNKVMLLYGRPFSTLPGTTEKRKIWGALVPYGKVWGLGADEATLIISSKPLVMGSVTLPAGTNSLYMLPVENGPSKLIINKQVGQMGLTYDEKQDIGRVDLKTETLKSDVDQFTIKLINNPDGGGILKLSWETNEFSIPFTVAK